MFDDKDIWLVSHSPRRIQLLSEMGLTFRTAEAHVDEVYPDGLSAEEIPVYLSRLKADYARCPMTPNTLVITADTIVAVDNQVLGKPASLDEARLMLHILSGRTHQVVTGVTLRTSNMTYSFAETTHVTFISLSDADIDFYVTSYQPLDKAGAYGVQEWIGMIGVSAIEGCFYNVMGLPMSRLYSEMKRVLG